MPAGSSDSVLRGETVRLLLVGDPFALALEEASTELEQLAGGKLEIEVVGYDDVRRLTLRNAQDKVSAYDLVSFDVVWAGEYGELGLLVPLEELVARARAQVEPEDFLDIAYAQSRYRGHQLGLPIQPHPELLWYRKDRLAADGLQPPRTTDELLQVARHYHKQEAGEYGIVWNGQRGQAFGQQMAHFYAAFGQPLLDRAGRPTLNTPQGVAAARFFSVVDQLSQAGQLQDWMRPAVPRWPQLAEILGTTYHDMLLGRLTPEQAAARAQQQAEALFALRATGH